MFRKESAYDVNHAPCLTVQCFIRDSQWEHNHLLYMVYFYYIYFSYDLDLNAFEFYLSVVQRHMHWLLYLCLLCVCVVETKFYYLLILWLNSVCKVTNTSSCLQWFCHNSCQAQQARTIFKNKKAVKWKNCNTPINIIH